MNAGLVGCDFPGDPDQYCYKNYILVILRGGGGVGWESPDPLSPSGSAHGLAATKLHLFYSVYLYTHARAIYPDELQALCFA